MYHKGYSMTVSLVYSVAVTLLGRVTSSATGEQKNIVDRWSSRGVPVIAAAVTDGLEVEGVWRCIAAHPIQGPSSSLLCHLLHLPVVIIIVVKRAGQTAKPSGPTTKCPTVAERATFTLRCVCGRRFRRRQDLAGHSSSCKSLSSAAP